MPLPYHLIDGYNLLHAAGFARATYGPGDLERARFGLLVRVADGLDDAERERTTVVFDAADPPPDAAGRFRFHEMTVLFAVETGEADALIEELIRRHSSPRQLRVVSDDVRLQRAAKRRGAQAVKSEAFLGRLNRKATSLSRPKDRTRGEAAQEAAGQTGDWLAFFGLYGDDLAAQISEPPAVIETDRPAAASRPEVGQPSSSLKRSDATSGRKKTSPERRPESRTPETDADAPAEDIAFWQRRIEEALADEDASHERRSDAS